MGVLTNYKKEKDDLDREIRKAEDEYKRRLAQLKENSDYWRCKYNDQITVINAERLAMREEIRALYDFLISLGNIGEQITPFNYETEDSLVSGGRNPGKKKQKPVPDGVGAGENFVMYALFGVATPLIKKRMADKAAIEKRVVEFELEKTEHAEQLAAEKNLKRFFKDATDIAIIYRNILVTVRDAIRYTVMPELKGIQAFLFADAIANKIFDGEDLSEIIVPSDIAEFKGTKYNEHYLFVRNVFDYYKLITTIFTEKILTSIVKDYKITQLEKTNFKRRIKEIEVVSGKLKGAAMFSKEA